ncbi:MAG: response regulator [Armatimonadetes bacterium]|nr:response regulator [Armatimonadota bacterium]
MKRHVLLVEDNPADVLLTREALREAAGGLVLDVVTCGSETLAFLRNQPPYQNAHRPDLILMDWNLPRMSGAELLGALKSSPEFLPIPVIVLSTSDAQSDIERAYRLHANCYVVKPMSYGEFVDAVRAFSLFWLSLARLPATQRAAR